MRTAETGRFAAFSIDGDAGPAPPLVAIPSGPGFSSATLRNWLQPLARSMAVVPVDLPGAGEGSLRDDEDYGFAAFIEDLDAVRKAMEAGKIALLGHGWGAALAVEYALARPQAVSALILIAPLRLFGAEGQDHEAQARMVEKSDPTLIERYLRDVHPKFSAAMGGTGDWAVVENDAWWNAMIRTQFAAAPPADWEEAVAGQRWGLRAYVTYKGAAMLDPEHEMAKYDLAERAAQLPEGLPMLILSSSHDANYVAPAREHASVIARSRSSAQLVLWDDVGHFPFVEQPERFSGLVAEFLGRSHV